MDNKTLARFELMGIPPTARGVPQIEVTFDIDANGLVHVSAKDLGTGRVQQVRIVSNSGLTEAEIQRMIGEGLSNIEGDKKKKELAELHNNADGLIYTTAKSMEEYGAPLSDNDKADIKSDTENLKQHLTQTEPTTSGTPSSSSRQRIASLTPSTALSSRVDGAQAQLRRFAEDEVRFSGMHRWCSWPTKCWRTASSGLLFRRRHVFLAAPA